MATGAEAIVRQWGPEQSAGLFLLEFPRGTLLPHLLEHRWVNREQYRIVGVLYVGDDPEPVVVGRRVTQGT